MPVGSSGSSGRIEISPDLKKELDEELRKENINLKQWFLHSINRFLHNKNQLNLYFDKELKGSSDNAMREAK
jgi:hypothetical protein